MTTNLYLSLFLSIENPGDGGELEALDEVLAIDDVSSLLADELQESENLLQEFFGEISRMIGRSSSADIVTCESKKKKGYSYYLQCISYKRDTTLKRKITIV